MRVFSPKGNVPYGHFPFFESLDLEDESNRYFRDQKMQYVNQYINFVSYWVLIGTCVNKALAVTCLLVFPGFW